MNTIRLTLALCVSMSLMHIALGSENKPANLDQGSEAAQLLPQAMEVANAAEKAEKKRKCKEESSERAEKRRRLQAEYNRAASEVWHKKKHQGLSIPQIIDDLEKKLEKKKKTLEFIEKQMNEGKETPEILEALDKMQQQDEQEEAWQKKQDEFKLLLSFGMTEEQAHLRLALDEERKQQEQREEEMRRNVQAIQAALNETESETGGLQLIGTRTLVPNSVALEIARALSKAHANDEAETIMNRELERVILESQQGQPHISHAFVPVSNNGDDMVDEDDEDDETKQAIALSLLQQ